MALISRRAKRKAAPYLLVLPALLLLGVFVYGVGSGIIQGFGIMPFLDRTTFTLEYYEQALTRADLAGSIMFSLYFSLVSAGVAVVGGVALSALMTRARTGRVMRLFGIQVPITTMHAVVALAVICLFSGAGLFPRVLHAVGLAPDATWFPSVVGAPSGWGIIVVYAWKEIPFVAFMTITIMMNISSTLGEAARTLGAGSLRAFFGITLPLCRGAILRAFLVVFAFAFGSYEIPFLLEPTVPKALPVLAYIEFQDPDIINRCYAMALNGIMAGICTLLCVAYYVVLQRDRRGGRGEHDRRRKRQSASCRTGEEAQ